MKDDLKNKAEELEQTLQAQLAFLRSDSRDWAKMGAGVLLGGLVAFGVVRALKGKKNNKNKKIMAVLEKEGLLDDEIVGKLNAKKSPGFGGRLAAILLPIAITYGREKLMNAYLNQKAQDSQDDESED
ncbi:hypothetical protein ACFSKL_16595 [Belliella marina]|uniref:Uncharacterized protein n=1 Tax=Belliella marina TaxID=1644146 RepID=A0ABW4VQK1_9BACT